MTFEIIKEGNYSGIRIKVPARLGNIMQVMQVDIGFGDVVTPGEVQMIYPTLIDMEAPQLLAYSTESLVSEKFQAMIDLGEYNSRMKDFYDVYKIIKSADYNNAQLKNAIKNTFEKRNTGFEENHFLFEAGFYQDEQRVTKWKAFLKKSKMDTELTFQEVMQVIKGTIKPIYDSLRSPTKNDPDL